MSDGLNVGASEGNMVGNALGDPLRDCEGNVLEAALGTELG